MALYDFAAPMRGTSLALQDQRTFGTVFRRSAEWTKEIPGLVSGLAKLAAPFKWHLAVIFAFNVVIALWETIQPFILAWGVDTFGANAPYLEIVAIIVFPMLAHRPAPRHRAPLGAGSLRCMVRQATIREACRPPVPRP